MTDRRARIVAHLDLAQPGLEIGPLDKPIVAREDGPVLYVDHASTADLRRKYDGDPNVGDIVDVDVVWGDHRLDEALGGRAPVAWVIGSHVVEHAPDLVGWLGELAAVLVPGGIVSLAVPDKRFCFDAKRRSTDICEVVAAAVERRTRPPSAAVYDFWARYVALDVVGAWAGTHPPFPPDDDALGLQKSREALSSPGYTDVHCWTFTPAVLADVLRRLFTLDLLPWYEVAELRPTEFNTLEFFVALRRLPDDLAAGERQARQLTSVPEIEDQIPAAPSVASAAAAPSAAPPGARAAVLSNKEMAMIDAKRRAVSAIRSTLRGARRVRG